MTPAAGDWCGCRDEGEFTRFCETHSCLMRLASSSHQGYCEECCDVPLYRREVEDVGEDVVRRAVGLMPDRQREYGERILALALKGGARILYGEEGKMPTPEMYAWAEKCLELEAENARLREEVERLRSEHYCGCAWCCASTPPDKRGETHKRTCSPHS